MLKRLRLFSVLFAIAVAAVWLVLGADRGWTKTAVAIPLTDPPFAVMAPVWGIGLITWWASAHATFPPRQAGSDH